MTGAAVRAVLLDMDGVIRHWRDAAAEQASGLPAGTFGRFAFDLPEYADTQVGKATHADWAAAVRRRLVEEFGESAVPAAEAWAAGRGEVDAEMVRLIRRLRAQVPVGLLSNATNRLREDLEHHGLHESFDVVLCSAELGLVKPNPAIFRHAAQVIGQPADACFFADDLAVNVDGARSVGMQAALFTSRAQLEAELTALGLHV
jgi:putative hydrolase of the HAD superfamily